MLIRIDERERTPRARTIISLFKIEIYSGARMLRHERERSRGGERMEETTNDREAKLKNICSNLRRCDYRWQNV